jgi:hypothetical protein
MQLTRNFHSQNRAWIAGAQIIIKRLFLSRIGVRGEFRFVVTALAGRPAKAATPIVATTNEKPARLLIRAGLPNKVCSVYFSGFSG